MKTFVLEDGAPAKLGENSKENWELIASPEVKGDHYWFHLSAFPSGHLVLLSNELTLGRLQECYSICKLHSKYRNHRNLKVDCTQIKNLRKTESRGGAEYKSNKKVKELEFRDILPFSNRKTFGIAPKTSPNKNKYQTNEDRIPQKAAKIST